MNDEDGSLREEIEEMFRGEACKHRREAHKTWNVPPGYYDDKHYSGEENHGLTAFLKELWAIRREKHPHRPKNRKKQ